MTAKILSMKGRSRKLLNPHPIADCFPRMTPFEMDGLVRHIEENGQIESIITLDGMVLDGRNRDEACFRLGIEPKTKPWDGTGGTPEQFVIGQNLHRRNLTITQRSIVAVSFANLRHGQNKNRSPSAGTPEITIKEAAKMMDVGHSTVENCKRVLTKGAPALVEKLKAGKITVEAAYLAVREADGNPRLKEGMSKAAEKRARTTIAEIMAKEKKRRHQTISAKSRVWVDLRTALKHLSNLPRPADVASAVRSFGTAKKIVDQSFPRALKWMQDFSNEWNDE